MVPGLNVNFFSPAACSTEKRGGCEDARMMPVSRCVTPVHNACEASNPVYRVKIDERFCSNDASRVLPRHLISYASNLAEPENSWNRADS